MNHDVDISLSQLSAAPPYTGHFSVDKLDYEWTVDQQYYLDFRVVSGTTRRGRVERHWFWDTDEYGDIDLHAETPLPVLFRVARIARVLLLSRRLPYLYLYTGSSRKFRIYQWLASRYLSQPWQVLSYNQMIFIYRPHDHQGEYLH
jgi:hypothetical protein